MTQLSADPSMAEFVEVVQIWVTWWIRGTASHATTIRVQMDVEWVLRLFEITVPREVMILSEVFPEETPWSRDYTIDEQTRDLLEVEFLANGLGITNNDELRAVVAKLLELIEQIERPDLIVTKSPDGTRSEISTKWYLLGQRIR